MLNVDFEDVVNDFQRNSNINTQLIQSVVNQFGDEESFVQSSNDVASYGIEGGFGGFIYYSETVKFAEENKDLIIELAKTQAQDFGFELLTMIKGFNCFSSLELTESRVAELLYHSSEDDEDYTQFYNGLAWYVAEEVCRSFADWADSENHFVNDFEDYARQDE